MAKFYQCINNSGRTFDCVLKFSEAKTIVAAAGGGEVVSMDIIVSGINGRRNIARILGNIGGYANKVAVHKVKGI